MPLPKLLCALILCMSFTLCHSQKDVETINSLDSIYQSLKSSKNSNENTFKQIRSTISTLSNDTLAGKYYKDFGNLRLDLGHWDSIAEQMLYDSYKRIKRSGENCKLVIVQFNLTRFALFQDSQETLERANHALEIANACGDLKHIAHAQSYIGAAYIGISDYKNALKNLFRI